MAKAYAGRASMGQWQRDAIERGNKALIKTAKIVNGLLVLDKREIRRIQDRMYTHYRFMPRRKRGKKGGE